MVSQAWRLDLPRSVYIALAVTVWLIYVSDRLYDVWKSARRGLEYLLETRHEFHYRNRGWFLLAAVITSVVLLRLLLFVLPRELMVSSIVPLTMTAGYFVFSAVMKSVSKPGLDRVPFGKNMLAGFTFAFGIAAAAFSFTETNLLFLTYPEILCMGLLFVLNITVIDLWRELRESSEPDDTVLLEAAISLPLILLAVFSLWQMVNVQGGERYLFGALFLSSAALQLLNTQRHRFSSDTLNILADVALLLPVPVFFLL